MQIKEGRKMKVIIEGKLYDTDRATLLATKGQESFYKTANGAYFQTGEYGLIPSDIETIKYILGEQDLDLYIKEFGTVEEA